MRRMFSVALLHACVLSAGVIRLFCSYTGDKCHLVSNKETAASTSLFPMISILKPCGSYRLYALVGNHIRRTINTAERNAKLLLTAKRCCTWKLGLMKNKQTETFFSFPVATNRNFLGPVLD